ncbi:MULTISPECIES: two-component system response regulator KdpE [unclassified Chromobacterium]|uniref:two-component system response regulator KdpE n=1 Tax=unclassified Chromobacterium TaxID=2641838 RepID=UPI0006528D46|nr:MULTISPECIES: two-component system response regulator KdpE [unclassified Chromobacterium]KMN35514.1 Fis family transcriptional regulator [Chromobacterium sp. LK1]KMN83714.1 Fis family transcriptional regulator [Chromobacterium sp. LK11]
MQDAPISIVVIEDEKPIRRFLSAALEEEGLTVHEAETGKQGLIEVATRKPDLVILDLGLPDMNGQDTIKQLREWTDLPILVLSARTQETEKVAALDAGADDYLTKPFGVAECLARVRVLLRRRTHGSAAAQQLFQFGDIKVDLVNRQVAKAETAVHLTPIEYRLLSTLIRNAGKVITHRELLLAVWGPSFSEHNQYLRVYMGHLRQKLEDNPAMPRHILTETGVGYRLVEG